MIQRLLSLKPHWTRLPKNQKKYLGVSCCFFYFYEFCSNPGSRLGSLFRVVVKYDDTAAVGGEHLAHRLSQALRSACDYCYLLGEGRHFERVSSLQRPAPPTTTNHTHFTAKFWRGCARAFIIINFYVPLP